MLSDEQLGDILNEIEDILSTGGTSKQALKRLRRVYIAGQRAAFEEAILVCRDSFTQVTGDFGRIAVTRCVDAIMQLAEEVGSPPEQDIEFGPQEYVDGDGTGLKHDRFHVDTGACRVAKSCKVTL